MNNFFPIDRTYWRELTIRSAAPLLRRHRRRGTRFANRRCDQIGPALLYGDSSLAAFLLPQNWRSLGFKVVCDAEEDRYPNPQCSLEWSYPLQEHYFAAVTPDSDGTFSFMATTEPDEDANSFQAEKGMSLEEAWGAFSLFKEKYL